MQELLNYLLVESNRSFLVTWVTVPAVLIAVYEILCVIAPGSSPSKKASKSLLEEAYLGNRPSILPGIALSLFLLFLGGYVYLMFYKEDFAYYDNVVLNNFSLVGKPYWMPIWKDSGRFWPLGLQEYNFLSLIGKNQLVYRSFSVIQLLIVLCSVNRILLKIPPWQRILTMFFVVISPGFLIVFFDFIYPERNVVFWLAVLLACSQSLLKVSSNYSRLYLYGVIVSAQFCLYYKEPVFILIGTFAGVKLVLSALASRQTQGGKRNYQTWIISLREGYADLSILVLSGTFISIYQIQVVPYIVSNYQAHVVESSLSTFLTYVGNDFLLSAFLLVFTLRLFFLVFSKESLDIFWDPLALGAVLYFLVFVRLRMYQAYYIAPVNFVGILYLSYFSFQAFSRRVTKNLRYSKYAALSISVCLGFLILIQSIQQSSFSILFRKTLINNHVQLTQAIQEYAKSSDKEVITLFFPAGLTTRTYLGPSLEYSITVFAAYLEYKGVDLYYENPNLPNESEDFVAADSEKKTFRLASPTKFPDNLCVPFAPFQCFYQSNPNQDDLIVILPGFSEPQKILGLKSNAEAIFSYWNIDNFSALERILFRFSQPPDVGYGDKTTHFSLMDVYLFESP